MVRDLPDDFYSRIKTRLYRRIGCELRLAHRVVDLGCGGCELARFLNQTYGQRVTGVDTAGRALPWRDHPTRTQKSLKCVQADAARLGFLPDGSIDAVVTMWALHEMQFADRVLREAHRVLRPGGEILIVDFPRDSLAKDMWGEDYYAPEEVAGMLRRAGFEDVRARCIERKQVLWASGFGARPTVAE